MHGHFFPEHGIEISYGKIVYQSSDWQSIKSLQARPTWFFSRTRLGGEESIFESASEANRQGNTAGKVKVFSRRLASLGGSKMDGSAAEPRAPTQLSEPSIYQAKWLKHLEHFMFMIIFKTNYHGQRGRGKGYKHQLKWPHRDTKRAVIHFTIAVEWARRTRCQIRIDLSPPKKNIQNKQIKKQTERKCFENLRRSFLMSSLTTCWKFEYERSVAAILDWHLIQRSPTKGDPALCMRQFNL